MRSFVFPDLPNVPALAATTGFFDGVHRGHVAVLQQLKQQALQQQLPTAVVSYAPHPRVVLEKEQHLQFLTTPAEKECLLAAQGIDFFITIPFTKAFSQLSTAEFVEQYLQQQLHVKHWIVGYNHRMGSGANNTFASLETLCRNLQITLRQTHAVLEENAEVSSTKIRMALQQGNVALANQMLNYPYCLSGTVVHGKKNGREIGFPTANLSVDVQKLLPLKGVYATWVEFAGTLYAGMLNIGYNPTVNVNQDCSVEVNIFDFEGDLYGQQLALLLVARLRDEQKFDSLAALKEALVRDKQAAANMLVLK